MDHVGYRYSPLGAPGPRGAGELDHVAQMRASLGGRPVAWAENEDLRTKVVVRGERRCFTVPLGLEWRSPGYTHTELSLCAAMSP